jgi:hypothetical protein
MLILALFAAIVCAVQLPLPSHSIPRSVDLQEGGRFSVHGWLHLPTDECEELHQKNNSVVCGFWSHHTPEFYRSSPHNFNIIIQATVELHMPVATVPGPPLASSFTPTGFSLNNLITNSPPGVPSGTFYNGSYLGAYPRVPVSGGHFALENPHTSWVHYLNESETEHFQI